jgi:glycosyltransferase involved in cell wall biosynthesis
VPIIAFESPEARISFTVVVPVYNCTESLPELCARIDRIMEKLNGQYEIILVDDRSPDNAWDVILLLQKIHPFVRGIRLSRNFGQHIAITAGLAQAKGEVVVVMDGDLQDPPELIADIHARFVQGYDLVLTRRSRRAHSTFRLLAAQAYFALLSRLTGQKIDGSYGSFSMLSRKVVEAFLKFSERERHYVLVLHWLGFRAGVMDYEHQVRTKGRSSYSLSRLIKHAIDGMLFQTTILLKWIVALGLLSAVAGLALAVYLIIQHEFFGSTPGWTSLAVLILMCTGAVLISLGVTALYIGKIFDQVKGRPLYIVDAISESAERGDLSP